MGTTSRLARERVLPTMHASGGPLVQPAAMPDTPLLRSVRTQIDAGIAAGVADAKELASARGLDELQRAIYERLRPGKPDTARLDADIATMKRELPLRTDELNAASMWQARHGLKDVWVDFVERYASELAPGQAQAAVQLLHDVRQATGDVTTYAKSKFVSPRPYVYDPSVPLVSQFARAQMLPTSGAIPPNGQDPNFYGYPSGHTSLSVAQATVLAALLPRHRDELFEAAHQVGLSRVYSAAHFPSDVEAGARIGAAVAAWMLAHSSLAPHDARAGVALGVAA